ncbi:hypothetical protein TWF569_008367 [Orbilia oligospora]|uniref:Mid2 domain-containing protein n=1 Tax=Orbilia oligospora TaxID=2813651 RepID=A0A7C8N7N3_ORBOL|nr:hypothetical protein TWF103_002106 [Orbilia oligospora]KAF3088708.1 hypothetical protein TWF102_010081 [Orbilia oligospora]KAF3139946.1 hypothetical protein TWF569_008367 [Orbilia oligospora]
MAPLGFGVSLLTALLFLVRLTVGQIEVPNTPRCYFPDGSLRNSTDYQPCNNVRGQHSMCCAIANRGSSADICLSNGLCSGATADGESRALWREGCTDPTWEDPACLKICLKKGSKYDWFSSDAPITLCQDGTVCCGGKVTGGKCCEAGEGVQLPTNFLRSTATVISTIVSAVQPSSIPTTERSEATVSTSSSSVRTSSPRSGASSTGPGFPSGTDSSPQITESGNPIDTTSPGMPDAAKIAIGVGTPVLVIGVALVAFFVWRRRTRHQSPPVYEKNSKGPVEIGTSDNSYYGGGYKGAGPYEIYSAPKPPPIPEHHVNVHELHS